MAGKKYIKALAGRDANKRYSFKDAIKFLQSYPTTKFDATVNLVVKLNVDTTQAEQQLRGAISLPNGTGAKIKILAITDSVEEAKKAGAAFVGGKEMIEKIKMEKWTDFELMIVEPKFMPELGKIGQILGPKGLMPNPKTGTVTPNVIDAVKEFAKGKIKYKTDKDGNVHVILGRVSFDAKALEENYETFISLIRRSRPSTVKGFYITNISLSTTMSPGVKLLIEE